MGHLDQSIRQRALLQYKMLTGCFDPLLMSDPVGCRRQVDCGITKEAITLSVYLENGFCLLVGWGELTSVCRASCNYLPVISALEAVQ